MFKRNLDFFRLIFYILYRIRNKRIGVFPLLSCEFVII